MSNDTAKVRIDEAEWYPVYSVRDQYGYEVEASSEQVARWSAALVEFLEVQEEMGRLYSAAEAAERAERERVKAEEEAAERTRQAVRVKESRARLARAKATRDRLVGATVYDKDGAPVGKVCTSRYGGLSLDPEVTA
jgi:membrane protein involved in colicin uptake